MELDKKSKMFSGYVILLLDGLSVGQLFLMIGCPPPCPLQRGNLLAIEVKKYPPLEGARGKTLQGIN